MLWDSHPVRIASRGFLDDPAYSITIRSVLIYQRDHAHIPSTILTGTNLEFILIQESFFLYPFGDLGGKDHFLLVGRFDRKG